jgi:hypothetical protein
MDSDHPSRMTHFARQFGDRDGRGVRGDHVARADQLVEFLDQRHLEIEDLRDRLDHDVRARDVFQIRGESDQGEHLVALSLVHLAAFDRAGQRLLHPPPGGIEELRQVTDDNGHARDRGHLGDARSHEPATYDGDRVDFSRHGCTPPPDRPDLLCVKSHPNVPLSASSPIVRWHRAQLRGLSAAPSPSQTA